MEIIARQQNYSINIFRRFALIWTLWRWRTRIFPAGFTIGEFCPTNIDFHNEDFHSLPVPINMFATISKWSIILTFYTLGWLLQLRLNGRKCWTNNKADRFWLTFLLFEVHSQVYSLRIEELPNSQNKLSSDGVYIGYMVDVADIHVYEFKTMEHVRTFRLSDKIVDFLSSPPIGILFMGSQVFFHLSIQTNCMSF